jgi:hypothetical protein
VFKYPNDTASLRALAEAYKLEKQYALMAKTLASVAAKDPQAANDDSLIDALKAGAQSATASNADAAESCVTVLEQALGARGAEALVDVATSGRGPGKSKAAALLGKAEVRQRLSGASTVLLDLRAATSCDARKALLPRVRADGDGRILTTLKGLTQRSGCGFLSASDCNPCLRDTKTAKELKEAIAAVETRAKSKP